MCWYNLVNTVVWKIFVSKFFMCLNFVLKSFVQMDDVQNFPQVITYSIYMERRTKHEPDHLIVKYGQEYGLFILKYLRMDILDGSFIYMCYLSVIFPPYKFSLF